MDVKLNQMKRFINILIIFLFTGIATAIAQIPYDVPNPANNTPIDLTNPADLVIYVILPVIIVILAIISWRYKKKHRS